MSLKSEEVNSQFRLFYWQKDSMKMIIAQIHGDLN